MGLLTLLRKRSSGWSPGDIVSGTFVTHFDMDVGVTEVDGKVSQWNAVAGSIANAAQSTANLRPTLTATGVYAGSGTNKVLDLSSSFDTTGGATIIVCGAKDVDGNECILLGGAGNANVNPSASGALAADLVIHDGSTFGTIANASHTTSLTISVIEIGAVTTTWWKNGGSSLGTMSSKFPVITKLLNRGSALDPAWRISDLILVSGTMSDEEKNLAGNYIATRRGISWTNI